MFLQKFFCFFCFFYKVRVIAKIGQLRIFDGFFLDRLFCLYFLLFNNSSHTPNLRISFEDKTPIIFSTRKRNPFKVRCLPLNVKHFTNHFVISSNLHLVQPGPCRGTSLNYNPTTGIMHGKISCSSRHRGEDFIPVQIIADCKVIDFFQDWIIVAKTQVVIGMAFQSAEIFIYDQLSNPSFWPLTKKLILPEASHPPILIPLL